MKAIINGKILLPDGVVSGKALLFDRAVTGLSDTVPADCETIDAQGLYVSPGFVDVHIHGYLGEDASDGSLDGLRRMARVACPSNGRVLEVHSDQPALQVYTGNFLDGTWTERDGRRLRQGDALALEPHVHPDGPNQPWPGDAVLRPGETFASAIEWRSPS